MLSILGECRDEVPNFGSFRDFKTGTKHHVFVGLMWDEDGLCRMLILFLLLILVMLLEMLNIPTHIDDIDVLDICSYYCS